MSADQKRKRRSIQKLCIFLYIIGENTNLMGPGNLSRGGFNDATEKLDDAYVNARIDGMITGELIDEKHEAVVRKLKHEIEECIKRSKELESKNLELRKHNIELVNELANRQNFIDSCEKATGYKKDGKS